MEIDLQVCDFEQAEKFKKLGLNLKTVWSWETDTKELTFGMSECPFSELSEFYIPAYTVAELGVLLPDHVHSNEKIYRLLIWSINIIAWGVDYFDNDNKILINRWSDQLLSKVLADRLIWLLDQKLLKIEDLKL